ncbi:nitrate regulatory protein [Thauera sinica]|uniref:Nitrate- and nitrite sensing domain-containing protein n=1 Tax=Thauera sinica TaxID=2665146 RepID=A0ABW1AS44_9RHOO|nr:nitrate regulatory protein [Thauera sp. K11]ATE58945.1 RNA-binding protein [Thauera sp. K11]
MQSPLIFLVAARRCEIHDLEQLALSCDLVQAVSGLVHRLQRERGTSNLYLASADARFDAQRAEHVGATRSAEDGVHTWLDGLAPDAGEAAPGGARLFTRIAMALHALDALPSLRAQVAARQCRAAEATQRYSRIVAALLALVFEAADIAVDPSVSRLLVSMFNLMQGKEFAGQERAAGAAAFAAGRLDADGAQTLSHLIEAQEQCLQRFEAFGTADSLRQWRALQALMPLPELERLRRRLMSSPTGGGLDRALADTWFDCCSQRLDLIHQAEAHLARGLKDECARRIDATRAELGDQESLLATLSASMPGEGLPAPAAGAEAGEPAAVDPAGAAAEPLGPRLTRSIVETMQAQSRRLQQMSDELAAVRAALDERKLVERAKGLLMAHHGVGEDEAYRLLRQTAMNQGRRLVDVARTLLDMSDLLPPRA